MPATTHPMPSTHTTHTMSPTRRLIRTLSLTAMLLPSLAWSQTQFLSNDQDLSRTAEAIVASVTAGNPAGAWKVLRPLSVVPSAEFDVFEATYASQQALVLQRFGEPLSYERVSVDKVGTSLQRIQLVVRHQKAPMRWLFVFYRTDKGWVITDFKFDGDVQALFSHTP
jgi:hypothetical protein